MDVLLAGLTGSVLGIGCFTAWRRQRLKRRLEEGRFSNAIPLKTPRCSVVTSSDVIQIHPSQSAFSCSDNNLTIETTPLQPNQVFDGLQRKESKAQTQCKDQLVLTSLNDNTTSNLTLCLGVGVEPIESGIGAVKTEEGLLPTTSCAQPTGVYSVRATSRDIRLFNDLSGSNFYYLGDAQAICNNLTLVGLSACPPFQMVGEVGACRQGVACSYVKDGFKFPNGLTSYIECQNGIGEVRECPPGSHFEANYQQCIYDGRCEGERGGYIESEDGFLNCIVMSSAYASTVECPEGEEFRDGVCTIACQEGEVHWVHVAGILPPTAFNRCNEGGTSWTSIAPSESFDTETVFYRFLTKTKHELNEEDFIYLTGLLSPPPSLPLRVYEGEEERDLEPSDIDGELYLSLHPNVNINASSRILCRILDGELTLTIGRGGWMPALDSRQRLIYRDGELVDEGGSEMYVNITGEGEEPYTSNPPPVSFPSSFSFLKSLYWYSRLPSISFGLGRGWLVLNGRTVELEMSIESEERGNITSFDEYVLQEDMLRGDDINCERIVAEWGWLQDIDSNVHLLTFSGWCCLDQKQELEESGDLPSARWLEVEEGLAVNGGIMIGGELRYFRPYWKALEEETQTPPPTPPTSI